MLMAVRGCADVWACFYHEIREAVLLDRYRALLSAQERQKEVRFRFAADRRCYLVTRALLRTVLSRYVALEPAQWVFAPNAYGKPEIANRYGTHLRLSFNLSHTDGLIVLGVTADMAIGVDTENIRTRRAPTGIAGSFFAPDEVAALRKLDVDEQQERFFDYWTLKEAYIKARGMGLSIALDSFSFDLRDDHGVNISLRTPPDDDPSSWRLRQFKASPDHLVALCTRREGPAQAQADIMIRKVIPLHAEEIMTCPMLRQSA
ncbi:4'-phosphopantetheinyl transferase family protein [Paraburkholderia aspalathi]|uniref:4'-phosphopantetheinyl transferase family protein n=1 Tax=Paraburkholderia aspalathi TaxID=1324617 RepID=UPI0038BDC402